MNTHDPDHDDLPGDDELKALYRSLPRKEPSPALDAAIKRTAADAVRGQRQRKAPRWPVAVASCAVIMVAAGLGWRMMQQPSSVPQIPTSDAVVNRSAPSNEPAAPAPAPSTVVADSPVAAPVAPAPAARMAASVRPKQENIRSAMKPKLVAPTVAIEQSPVVATEPAPIIAMQEDRASYTSSAAPAPPAAPPASVAESTAAAYAPAPAAPPATIGGDLDQRPMAGRKAMAAPAPMAAPMPALSDTAAHPSDTPAQELAKIRLLFALQRHDEAMQRLLAFQQAHPDVALPDDLRAQLPNHE